MAYANGMAPIPAKPHRKTERSHEENQERAYTAASRRQDRSIEARVQSARRASEIHKKRTGKGFKISEEIVMKEEMYEEEDDLPRSYKALAAHMSEATAPEMHRRLSAFLVSKVAMSSLARDQDLGRAAQYDEIDRKFAAEFPNANQVSRNLQTAFQTPIYGQQQQQQRPRSQSMAAATSMSTPPSMGATYALAPALRHRSTDSEMSPPAQSPTSVAADHSPFTSELSPEVKQMVYMNYDEVFQSPLGGQSDDLDSAEALGWTAEDTARANAAVSASSMPTTSDAMSPSEGYFTSAYQATPPTNAPGLESIAEPTGEFRWDSWIDPSNYAVDD